MIYIVSGYMRTGTSMMMKALSEGGLEPVFNINRNKMNNRFGDDDYQPNAAGFYELVTPEYRNPDFHKIYNGKLVKILTIDQIAVKHLKHHDYRVVFMKRHPEEIRQSFDGFWGNARLIMRVINNYEEIMDKAIALFRKSAKSVDVFQYRDVVENPSCLEDLDWPIDIEKAKSVINPALCRFRLENLVVGL